MTVQEGGDPAGTGTSYYHVRAGEEVLPATPTGTRSWRPTSRRRRSSRPCEAQKLHLRLTYQADHDHRLTAELGPAVRT